MYTHIWRSLILCRCVFNSLTLTSWLMAPMPEESFANTHIFSGRLADVLHLGVPDCMSAPRRGTICNRKSVKNTKLCQLCHSVDGKRCWLTLRDVTRGAELRLPPAQLRAWVLGSSNFSLLCSCVCPWTARKGWCWGYKYVLKPRLIHRYGIHT